jgi:hypothetical protein
MKPAIETAKAAIRAARSKNADQASRDVVHDTDVPPACDANPKHREDKSADLQIRLGRRQY